ncbi:MAG TPA: stage III sporulation protein AE [Syntrophomonadaceae bacterium]|nr:stage III sporulation protein AE [Syntrophomonadaceae bacterium]
MKRLQFLLLLLLALLVFPCAARADTQTDTPKAGSYSFEDAVKSLDLSSLEEYKHKVDQELGQAADNRSLNQWFTDFIKGSWKFDIKQTGSYLSGFFLREILANSSLLGKLLLLSVLAALLVNLQTSFSTGIAKISYWACYLALAAMALASFRVVLEIGQQTIDTMAGFMTAMLPQMLVLTAGLGNVNASVMLFPILMTAATAFAGVIKNIVFPLIIMSAILSIVNHLSDSLKVEKMGKLFSQAAQLTMGLTLTLFVGVLTLRSVYASVLDKVALRTTKFITDNAIPLVGKMFSDTVEVAAGYVVMLKQALGIFGVVVVAGIVILPLIKIAAIALIYRISAMLVEPLGDGKTATILESMSTHLFMMLAAVAAVGLMFLIMIAIIAGMSNGFAMLRS